MTSLRGGGVRVEPPTVYPATVLQSSVNATGEDDYPTAIHNATGIRIRDVPITPDKLLREGL